MHRMTRREVLKGSGVAFFSLAVANFDAPVASASPGEKVGKVAPLATDIYFHEGDIQRGYCNSGWVLFEDYVLVIDASFPSGAQQILPQIRALTNKPIRFAFDTHHHGDHAYGNQVMIDNGATPVAHTGVIEEMKRYETGYYDSKPGRWEETAKERSDVRASRLKPPSVLFPQELIFDDGKHRVELLYLGVAHTHGDVVAWLPKERILFAGDVCVNGPYNYVGDGDVEKWVGTLDMARRLGARVVCPGHGPRSTETVLVDQQSFFQALRDQVGALVQAKKSAKEVQDSIERIRTLLKANAQVARYVSRESLADQVEKVYTEMTGQRFPAGQKTARDARRWHTHAHGLSYTG